MSRPTSRHWRELVAIRYLDALDAGDPEAIAAWWRQAEADPDLDALLCELEEGLEAEEGADTDLPTDAAQVLELARRHLPSAFPPEEPPGPLTAAEVARRLEAEPEFRRVSPEDRLAHARMLAEATPLPDLLGQPQIERWVTELGVEASPLYWRAFQKVAVLMTMARCQRAGRLAAARPAPPKAEPPGGSS